MVLFHFGDPGWGKWRHVGHFKAQNSDNENTNPGLLFHVRRMARLFIDRKESCNTYVVLFIFLTNKNVCEPRYFYPPMKTRFADIDTMPCTSRNYILMPNRDGPILICQ